MNELTDYQKGWVAGILDGEGCFSVFKRKGSLTYECSVLCEMTDKDTVYKLQEYTGIGRISTRENIRKDGRTRKRSYIWCVYKKKDIEDLIVLIFEGMSERRKKKINEIYEALNVSK